MVKADIPVSHLCPPSPVPSTLHLFLLAFAAPCTGFLLVFCLINLFPSVSVHVVAFSIRPYQMLFHNPKKAFGNNNNNININNNNNNNNNLTFSEVPWEHQDCFITSDAHRAQTTPLWTLTTKDFQPHGYAINAIYPPHSYGW